MSSNLINMDHIAMPLRTPAARGIATADTIGLPPADWSAFDQELIDSVLFPSAPAHATTAVSTPPPSSSSHAMFPLHHDFTGLSQATVSPSGAIIGARPVESETMSPLPLDQSGPMGTKRPAPQDVTGAQPKQPKKRQRKYTDDTRAKHREVQRRFINRKKERLDQEKMLAVVLEKQVQLLQAQSEAASLESERSSLLQQCVANGIDLDGQDMTVFLEEEMEALSQYYTPLQPSEASAILQQTLRYVDGFCPDEAFLDEGINFVGWNHQSRVEQKTISFRISKEFPETAPAQVFESTGFAMATVEHFSNFFGSGVVIKTKLLQIIDMNTVILYRAIYHPATKEISRFVELLCRVKRGDDYLILMQSLEGLNIQTFVGTQESWVRGVVWCAIKPQIGNDNGCSIQWTGCVGQCPTESLEQWRRDLMFLILRYEGLVIKPLVQLTIEDEPTDSNTKPTESQPQSLQQSTTSSRSSESSASSSSGGDDSDESNDADDTATGSDSA